jgi:hypothetical protein
MNQKSRISLSPIPPYEGSCPYSSEQRQIWQNNAPNIIQPNGQKKVKKSLTVKGAFLGMSKRKSNTAPQKARGEKARPEQINRPA